MRWVWSFDTVDQSLVIFLFVHGWPALVAPLRRHIEFRILLLMWLQLPGRLCSYGAVYFIVTYPWPWVIYSLCSAMCSDCPSVSYFRNDSFVVVDSSLWNRLTCNLRHKSLLCFYFLIDWRPFHLIVFCFIRWRAYVSSFVKLLSRIE